MQQGFDAVLKGEGFDFSKAESLRYEVMKLSMWAENPDHTRKCMSLLERFMTIADCSSVMSQMQAA